MNLICLNIGNTSGHFGYFSDGKLIEKWDVPTGKLGEGCGVEAAFARYPDCENFSFCSVVPSATQAVWAVLKNLFPAVQAYQLTCDNIPGLGFDYPAPEEVGGDRMANAVAVQAMSRVPAVVIENDTLNVFPDIDLESRQYIKELGLYKRQLVRTFVTLGGYEWVNAEKSHDFWDNTKVTYGLGLLKSYTYVDPTSTQYQITANLEIEQPINSWLTASGKAMFVSNPIYKFNKSNGTLFKGNPLFMQNEAEINLNAHYNNVMVDIGLRSIFNGFSGGGKNLNLINTRMTIGF